MADNKRFSGPEIRSSLLHLIISVSIKPIFVQKKFAQLEMNATLPVIDFGRTSREQVVQQVMSGWLSVMRFHLEHTKWIIDGTPARSKTLRNAIWTLWIKLLSIFGTFTALIMVESWLAGISTAVCFPLIRGMWSTLLKKAVISGIFNKLSLPCHSKH